MTSPRTSYLRPLVALVALVAAMAALLIAYNASPTYAAPVCSTTAGTKTCTFSSTGGEQTFEVPQGVSSVDVVATGAPGAVAFDSGDNTPAPPGRGAVVSGTLTGLTPGQTLYVNVGGAPTGAGTSGCGGQGSADCIGGFNGGGSSFFGGGGGGGASDVRTKPRTVPLAPSDDSRLIVAAGGGGAGIGGNCTPPGSSSDVGGRGGDAESDGGDGESCGEPPFTAVGGTGGQAGTQFAGGLGGVPEGERGSLGQGGSGGSLGSNSGAGGGGGGGYYGGGGGGGQDETGDFFSGSGGGGGGSDLLPPGGFGIPAQDTSVPPSVTISYRTGGVGEPPPTTEQPQSKEECKKGGWKEFGFKNQGQCIKAVNHPS
jgi:hypothetical protein